MMMMMMRISRNSTSPLEVGVRNACEVQGMRNKSKEVRAVALSEVSPTRVRAATDPFALCSETRRLSLLYGKEKLLGI
jgi:hypothetical protein